MKTKTLIANLEIIINVLESGRTSDARKYISMLIDLIEHDFFEAENETRATTADRSKRIGA